MFESPFWSYFLSLHRFRVMDDDEMAYKTPNLRLSEAPVLSQAQSTSLFASPARIFEIVQVRERDRERETLTETNTERVLWDWLDVTRRQKRVSEVSCLGYYFGSPLTSS